MDGIAEDVGGEAKVVRVELPTEAGRRIATRYGVEFTPTFLVFDSRGELVERVGAVDRARLVAALRRLAR